MVNIRYMGAFVLKLSNVFGLFQDLIDHVNASINKRKEDEECKAELSRADVIKCIQSQRVRFRGVNLSGLDLSKLVCTVLRLNALSQLLPMPVYFFLLFLFDMFRQSFLVLILIN